MGMLKDFKEFALKGNVIDLAVAVIIGAAFGAIVSSLVDDIITPALLAPILKAAHADDLDKWTVGAMKPGKFVSAVIKFGLIAFVLFLVVKAAQVALKKKEAAPAVPPPPTTTEKLLMEIRDSLKK